jgi:hypothetical protein
VKKELAAVKTKFAELQFTTTQLENQRITPAQHQELLAIQAELSEQLNLFQAESKNLSAQLAKINQQDWLTTLSEKIAREKTKLEKLQDKIQKQLNSELLGETLESFLEVNEQLITLIIENKVKGRTYSLAQKQLAKKWAKLQTQISFAELQNFWQVHSQIIKMEFQHQQWMEWQNPAEELKTYILPSSKGN